MKEGTFIFYVIEEKNIAETEYGCPDGPMVPYDGEDRYANFHYAHHAHVAEPNDRKHNTSPSRVEMDEIAQISSFVWHGWWTLKYAIRGLQRVLKAYYKGEFHYRNNTYDKKITRRIKLEFRISKVTISKKIEPVDMNEVIKAF